jgi:hypothetical protein
VRRSPRASSVAVNFYATGANQISDLLEIVQDLPTYAIEREPSAEAAILLQGSSLASGDPLDVCLGAELLIDFLGLIFRRHDSSVWQEKPQKPQKLGFRGF